MKFTLDWQKDYLDFSCSLGEICATLDRIGLEVESLETRDDLKPFIVAHVKEVTRHPDATSLNVCKIEVGGGKILNIVCGGSNVRPDMHIILAQEGTLIPANGMVIKKASVRGVPSEGMICSSEELKLEWFFRDKEKHERGIVDLEGYSDLVVGKSLLESIPVLASPVIEIKATPDRGDALCVMGIARDLAAAGVGVFRGLTRCAKVPVRREALVAVRGNSSTNNSSFKGLTITNLTNQTSPDWLKNRLAAVGIKTISAVVDVTNYILFSIGKPMHAYDADKIKSKSLMFDFAKDGEKFVALNDEEYILSSKIGVIRTGKDGDDSCIAGVIGGKDTSVTMETKNIFLESAVFDPVMVANSGRELNIITDSRYRFERGIDSALVEKSLEWAACLIMEICGGEVSEVTGYGSELRHNPIAIDFEYLRRLSTFNITNDEVASTLSKLGFTVNADQVTAPSWRHDIACQEDIFEEIIRIIGLDNITPSAIDFKPNEGVLLEGIEDTSLTVANAARKGLQEAGYNEVVNFSFIDSAFLKKFDAEVRAIKIANPISSDLDVMVNNLLPGLLQIAINEQNINEHRGAIFEIANEYNLTDGDYMTWQKKKIALLKWGLDREKDFYNNSKPVDFFAVKSDVFNLLANHFGLNVSQIKAIQLESQHFHPGKAMQIQFGNNVIGLIGEIHPKLINNLELKTTPVYAELDVELLLKIAAKKLKNHKKTPISRPLLANVEREFCFICDSSVAVGEIISLILQKNRNLISNIVLTDLYQDEKMKGEGKKSIVLQTIIAQSGESALTSTELEKISNDIIGVVEGSFSAKLRVA